MTDEIEEHRQKGVSDLLGSIEKIASTYDSSHVNCRGNFGEDTDSKRYACDGLILGTLLKSASSVGLWPLPEPPYMGMSITQTADKLKDLKIMAMCDGNFRRNSRDVPPDAHGLVDWVRQVCEKVELEQQGLNFELLAFQATISDMQRSLSHQL